MLLDEGVFKCRHCKFHKIKKILVNFSGDFVNNPSNYMVAYSSYESDVYVHLVSCYIYFQVRMVFECFVLIGAIIYLVLAGRQVHFQGREIFLGTLVRFFVLFLT